jgi:hypothetical protein
MPIATPVCIGSVMIAVAVSKMSRHSTGACRAIFHDSADANDPLGDE